MKTKLITLLVLAIFTSTYAQFGSEQIITTNALYPSSVYATDIDGDGDNDVLSTSGDSPSGDDKIAWYRNNGDGNFGPQRIITTVANGARSVYAEDLDGDGDMDVLSASWEDNKIAWYENDGNAVFGSQQIITTNADGARSVYATDIDGDGDMDVLSASSGDNKIAWYENNGDGNFGPQQIITTNADGARSVYAEDLDGDGDMDVLSASWDDDKIAWYENDGDGGFGSQQIITTNADGATSVYAEDLDGDGDNDVLSASWDDDKIAWYENDGDGGFGSQQIITTNADGARSVYATDIDGDGDMDVLSASFYDGNIAWYENVNGDGSVWVEHVISIVAGGARSVYASDLDGDGDMDVLSASFPPGPPVGRGCKVAWYKNSHPLGVNENTLLDFLVYPSPTTGMLTIESKTPITEIEIYNQLGQLVLSNSNQNEIDMSSVSQGVYFIKIIDENGNIGTQKVVKK